MDILKRSMAPITEEAWNEINETASRILKTSLSARKFVDVDGPKGWDFGAVSIGRLDNTQQAENDVNYGMRMVQPLVEARVMFELDVWELDNASRGAKDIDLGALEDAARKMALFEEKAIYQGFKAGGIKGLRQSSEHEPITFGGEPQNLLHAVTDGITMLAKEGVDGPYRLVIGNQLWRDVAGASAGYPLRRQLERLLGSEPILNPLLEDTLLVSMRGGDLQLTLGNDLAIGFNWADAKKVKLFFTESFTFQVFDGAAFIPIQQQG